VIEVDYIPSEKSQRILNYILGDNMTWYLQKKKDPIMTPFFYHSLMTRSLSNYPQVGTIKSELFEPCKEIFLEVCDQANIATTEIYRASLNTTFYHPEQHTGIHVDHEFFHKNFVMYLNDATGSTYVFDDEKNVLSASTPKKNRAVFFDGNLHAQGSCDIGEVRTVLVITFK
jgi:hypothetical protein